jgi:hypothetical protein
MRTEVFWICAGASRNEGGVFKEPHKLRGVARIDIKGTLMHLGYCILVIN